MKTWALQWVLNKMTPTENEAMIDFGKAKMKLLVSIYNWRISYPGEVIYIALADITACFCFPRISADITSDFGFMADEHYFLVTSHVFGSNTSASSWEPLWRSIEALIPIYIKYSELVEKHKELLFMLKCDDCSSYAPEITHACACEINQGELDERGDLLPPIGNIYVDNILSVGHT